MTTHIFPNDFCCFIPILFFCFPYHSVPRSPTQEGRDYTERREELNSKIRIYIEYLEEKKNGKDD